MIIMYFVIRTNEAFKSLVFLSETLLQNSVLQLQKAKTRIMSSAEFLSTTPLGDEDDEAPADRESPSLKEQSHNLMRLSLRFDPYSATAADDYSDLLYPIYANVLFVAKDIFTELRAETRNEMTEFVKALIRARSYIMQVPLNLAYAVRLLSCESSADNEELLDRIYNETKDIGIRRDIILTMSRWQCWEWLSNFRNTFRTLSPLERRAFIVASYQLRDEGKHWRQHVQNELSPLEKLVQKWSVGKVGIKHWRVPL
jgi:hypothetical protein